jgi:alkanesulfonate monooxygenase SsuD/methylene tetrahydromethanopterin reductase-like flavin-dependent oxidoreductase (luciferase family)
VEFGAHLPLLDLDGRGYSLGRLRDYAATAAKLGYTLLSANDHLLFARPWLDGPTALAAIAAEAEGLTLATSLCLPVVRGPVQTAKSLAALDVLAGGRLIAGVGPGSSARDYEAVGVPFDERWPRFEEAVQALHALLHVGQPAFAGRFYSTSGVSLEPPPMSRPGPPIWIGSWGSKPGLRRAARLADGWFASAYNTTPDGFRSARSHLAAELEGAGKNAATFPNGLATAWLYVTEDRAAGERLLGDVLAPMLNRPVEQLRELSLPIGPQAVCAERLAAFAEAGVERVLVWPLADELRQLEVFQERVVPMVEH